MAVRQVPYPTNKTKDIKMDIKIVNTILYCGKWKETVAFYKKILRLPETSSLEWFVEFELNSTSRLSIADASKASVEPSAGRGITITLKVDDIEAACAFLMEKGLKDIAVKEHAWGSKVIHFSDPEGNRLEFWS